MKQGVVVAGARSEGALPGERSIGDVARCYDVSLRTLRFYEDKGLLQPRRQGTARFYSARDRIRLELILKGKRLGFSLAEIYRLVASRGAPLADAGEADLAVSLGRERITAQLTQLERQRDELETAIGELRSAMLQVQPT